MTYKWNFNGPATANAAKGPKPEGKVGTPGYASQGKPGKSAKMLVRVIVCAACVSAADERLGQSWMKRACARCGTACEPGIVVQS